MKMRLGVVVLVLLCAVSPAQAKPKVYRISGSVLELGCVATSLSTDGSFECVGRALLDGSWNGLVEIYAKGKSQLGTGNVRGSVVNTFDGKAGDRQGTLLLKGTFSINGTTGAEKANVKIVKGTGAFRGATGSVSFSLFNALSAGPAQGTYAGKWTHPAFK